jgi:hypothetical protein
MDAEEAVVSMRHQIEELRKRLERAERELQALRARARWARGLLAVTLVAGVAFVGTRPTATLAQFPNLKALHLRAPVDVLDGAGRPILQIGASTLGRGLLLFDESGKTVCGIGVTSQGRGLAVFDAQEKMVAGLGEGRSPDAVATGRGLLVTDAAQKVIGTLGAGLNTPNNGRGLSVNDESGRQVVGLGVWPQRPDRGQFVLSDRNNKILFAQPALP